MNIAEYNEAMARVRAVLFTERAKGTLRWTVNALYLALLAEGVWFLFNGWFESGESLIVFFGTLPYIGMLTYKLLHRLERGF